MKEQLELIRQQAIIALDEANTPAALDEIRVRFLGKKGELTAVLKMMGKPENAVYKRFSKKYTELNEKMGLKQYLVPYLMSSHPGSTMKEAVELIEEDMEIPVPDLVDMCGPGYSIPSEEGNEAIAMMMELEGIVLDTCYTGKAFAGLVKRARAGEYKPEDNVLFVHSGGAGGLFAQDWENL